MTTGDRTVDNQYLDVSGHKAGSYFAKSWNGADDPIHKKAWNNYSMSSTDTFRGTFRRTYWNGSSWVFLEENNFWNMGTSYYPVFQYGSWSSDDDLTLLCRLRQKLAGHSFNAGVALGESHETFDMVASTVRTAHRAYKALRRGDGRALRDIFGALGLGPRGPWKGAANLWLQYQYGWRPLIQDLYAAAEAVFRLTNPPISFVESASLKRLGFVSSMASRNPPQFFRQGYCFRKKKMQVVVTENWSPMASLGLDDPATVVWELVPFSFVVDWFIPFGNYLEARALATRLGNAPVLVSDFKVGYCRQAGEFNSGGRNPEVWSYSESVMKECFLSRSVSGVTVPGPSFTGFSGLASWQRMASAVSLFVQRV